MCLLAHLVDSAPTSEAPAPTTTTTTPPPPASSTTSPPTQPSTTQENPTRLALFRCLSLRSVTAHSFSSCDLGPWCVISVQPSRLTPLLLHLHPLPHPPSSLRSLRRSILDPSAGKCPFSAPVDDLPPRLFMTFRAPRSHNDTDLTNPPPLSPHPLSRPLHLSCLLLNRLCPR